MEALVRSAAQRLYSIPGVVGVGWDGRSLIVYVESENVKPRIPATVLGLRTVVKVVGRIRPL